MRKVLRTYYQLTKPGIVYGNSLSVIAGLLLGFQGSIDPVLFIVTVVGIGLIMASACVYNNYLDRGIDVRMARTKQRALVTGEIKGRQALIFATLLSILGFGCLVVFTNTTTVMLGVIAIIMYVAVYGAAKRLTTFGTIVGSISGALPPAAGYTAVTGHFDGAAWLLFLIMTLWQMPHFYAIAIYRLKEYAAAGLPVLPVKRGIARTKRSIMAYILVFGVVASLLAVLDYAGYVYFIIVGTVSLIWFVKGLSTYRKADDVKWARGMFFFSLNVLLAWTVAIAIDSFIH